MSRLHVKYLLVGGGVASLSAARAIRQTDAAGTILMVGQESVRPYHRALLTTLPMRWPGHRDDLFAVDPGWFTEQRIELRTGCRAVRLDVPRMAAFLDSGDLVSFERLLLATGAAPRHLQVDGADLPNIFYLRTLGDAERLHHAIEQAKQHRRGATRADASIGQTQPARPRAVVVGGGLLGVELAAGLSAAGMELHLVESAGQLWPRFAGDLTAKAVGRAIGSRPAVHLHLDARPARFEGDGRVQRAVLSDGATLTCDLVVVAAGSIVPSELLRGTAIACERAILVDRNCQSSIPGIFAAGDCCAVLDPLFGKHRWIDYGDHAVVTGRIAGVNMAAPDVVPLPASYNDLNRFDSRVLDLQLTGWGEARFVSRRIFRGSAAADSTDLIELGIADDGRIAQILTLNHPADEELLRRAVAERRNVLGREDDVRDPAVPIGRWLA